MRHEFSELFKLGRAERLQLVEDLWDSIAKEEDSSPISVRQRQELRKRRERLLREPHLGRSWQAIKGRIRGSEHD